MIIIKEIRTFKNNVIKVGRDHAILEITNKRGWVTEILISLEDVNEAAKYSWSVSYVDGKMQYVKNAKVGYLHRHLIQPHKGMVVDHINHDISDNRRCNLRCITRRENQMNRSDSTLASIAGITLTHNGKYHVRLRNNQNYIYSKVYKTKEEAVKARLVVELTYGLYINADLYKVMLSPQEINDAVAGYMFNYTNGRVLEKVNTAKICNLMRIAA